MKYVDLISNDWNGTSKHTKNAKQKNKGNQSNSSEITLLITNVDDETEYKKSIKADTSLKSLFNGYTDEYGVSLRSLRFSYNGSTLFLSSVGQKTPVDLGMKHMDVINVSSNKPSIGKSKEQPAAASQPNTQSKSKSKKSTSPGKVKHTKKQPATQHQTISISLPESDEERDKVTHSKLLSLVFEEMQPKLKTIRQHLNDLMLDRQSSKVKGPSNRKKALLGQPNIVSNPSTVGIGAKAGKTCFVVNVGRVESLYKTCKRDTAQHHGQQHAHTTRSTTNILDLHGCTHKEALEQLGTSLKVWMDTAMHGSYPWVISATIICGAGNQILSETVETWIKETKTVANAPKGNVRY